MTVFLFVMASVALLAGLVGLVAGKDYDQEYGPINTHIEVRIKNGTYLQTAAVQWTYYTPGYYVSFMPSDYKWGGWGSFEARPVFSGSGSEDSNWFELLAGPGEWTQLAFYYIEVSNSRP